MKGRMKLLSGVISAADLDMDLQPRLPLLEVAGDRRVLIENHQCVTAYTTQEVHVRVSFGVIQIKGRGLNLARMGKEQLVITGCIDSVTLCRGKKQ